MSPHERNEYHSKPKKFELDIKHRDSPPAKPFIEEAPKLERKVLSSHLNNAPKLECKVLSSHLNYVFLGRYDTLSVIIAAYLNGKQGEYLVVVCRGSYEPLD